MGSHVRKLLPWCRKILITTLLGAQAFGAATPAVATSVISRPRLKAHISLGRDGFDQTIQMTLSPALDLTTLRNNALNTDLLKELSSWVADANYKEVGADAQFWLTVGKDGQNFTQMFHCRENAETAQWQLVCDEDEKTPSGKKAVINSTRSVHCVNTAATESSPSSSTCTFEMKGQAQELTVFKFMHISPREISYTLFAETVSYVLGMSFLATGLSPDVAAAIKLRKDSPVYAELLDHIDTISKHIKETNASAALSYDFSSDERQSMVSNALDVPSSIDEITGDAMAQKNM